MSTVPKDVLKGLQVLVVEDEPDSLEVIMIILQRHGALVSTAANGREALVEVQAHRPAFIISDIAMPLMDGWGLIAALKRDRATAGIPVIALTAHGSLEDREKALAAGFHNYLSKPLTIQTFISQLIAVLDDVPELSAILRQSDD